MKKVLKWLKDFWHKGILAKIVIIVIVFTIVGGINNIKNKISESRERSIAHNKEYVWPDSNLASMLPTPSTTKGVVENDDEDSLTVLLFDVNEKTYTEYVSLCKKKGFTVDYNNSSDDDDLSYTAKNSEEYELTITYYLEDFIEDKDTMKIHLEKKTEETPIQEEPVETIEPDNSNTPNEEMIDGMRKSFKDSMDSYEAFFDKYIDFMNKYESSSDQFSMISEYTDMLSQYTDTMEKFDNLKDDDLNSTELAYYTQVQLRINNKLMDVIQ